MAVAYMVSLQGLDHLMMAPAVFSFGLVAFGFLGMGPVTIAVDSYGPVTDNAQSVFELSMIETLNASGLSEVRQQDLIGLFPGSRWREVRKILPTMLRAVEHIHAALPQLRFEVASASISFNAEIERLVRRSRLPKGAVTITTGQAEAAMQRARAAIIASGTATLQAAFFRLPFVLVYRVAWLTYLAARMVVKVKYLGMPNVIAGREVVPEFIQHRADPRAIARATLRLLQDKSARDAVASEFDRIIATLGQEGASSTAAEAILDELG